MLNRACPINDGLFQSWVLFSYLASTHSHKTGQTNQTKIDGVMEIMKYKNMICKIALAFKTRPLRVTYFYILVLFILPVNIHSVSHN